MRRVASFFLSSFLVAMAPMTALAAPAQDRAQAEAALKEGVKAYKEERYEEALTLYQKAAGLAPEAPGPYREMGKVYEALGQDADATLAYQEYLKRRPDADDANDIKERLNVLTSRNPSPAPTIPTQGALAAPPVETVSPLSISEESSDQTPQETSKKRHTLLWVAGGVALVGVGVGTAIALDELTSGKNRGGKGGGGNGGDDKQKALTFHFVF